MYMYRYFLRRDKEHKIHETELIHITQNTLGFDRCARLEEKLYI